MGRRETFNPAKSLVEVICRREGPIVGGATKRHLAMTGSVRLKLLHIGSISIFLGWFYWAAYRKEFWRWMTLFQRAGNVKILAM
jgi:hypothetical protein